MRIGRQQGRRVRPGLASGCEQLLLPSQFHRAVVATFRANPPTMPHLASETPSVRDKAVSQSGIGQINSYEKTFFVETGLFGHKVGCGPGCVPGL